MMRNHGWRWNGEIAIRFYIFDYGYTQFEEQRDDEPLELSVTASSPFSEKAICSV